MYELITEKEAFRSFKFKPSPEIYNHIRSKNFEFFNENKLTGNKEVDELIANCTNRKPELRPKISEIL